MEIKNIPSQFHPAYTWLWNTTITKEGIRSQLQEMHDSGIRAFYVIGEPENFRPKTRRTHLSPEYLSDEYLELLSFAHQTGKELGMTMWLYNEGGFPSGMVCGAIRKAHPELAMQELTPVRISIHKGFPYIPSDDSIGAFIEDLPIQPNELFSEDTELTEYRICPELWSGIRTDNASPKNTGLFLQMTHERLKQSFGASMGSDIILMFDDEAYMGTWTDGFDKIFRERNGYDIKQYLPWITGELTPETMEQHKACSDYYMLCGDLVRNNYFTPMKDWLRRHNMRSTGHLDNDHRADGNVINRYGNTMKTLREFDVPGVDVIWEQIAYPTNCRSACPEGVPFFPRMASSAARQLGHTTAVSESLAVYGSHVDPELMRYVVNYQAVRGISLFNFMVVSFDRETPMSLQYRPNFNSSHPSLDRLTQINEYTARLSYLLQNSQAEILTALYFPARSICAKGKIGQDALESFTSLGKMLEAKGISFDIIDEELVRSAETRNRVLQAERVSYRYIFIPEGALEPQEILEKLASLEQGFDPCIIRENPAILARKLLLPDGNEGFFLCNTAEHTVTDTVGIPGEGQLYRLDLMDGTLYRQDAAHKDGIATLHVTLERGEGLFLMLSTDSLPTQPQPKTEFACELTEFTSFISRKCYFDHEKALQSTFFTDGQRRQGLYEWDSDFSGEVTYLCPLPKLEKGRYFLNLGSMRSTAAVYIDGEKVGEATLPPYRISIDIDESKELQIIVANTSANICANTDYFMHHDIADVGPYHANMVKNEARQPGGGLFGPVTLHRLL